MKQPVVIRASSRSKARLKLQLCTIIMVIITFTCLNQLCGIGFGFRYPVRRRRLPLSAYQDAVLVFQPESSVRPSGLSASSLFTKSCPDVASVLFNHWKSKTRLHLRRFDSSVASDIPAVLKQHGVLSDTEYCYCKFVYNGDYVERQCNLRRHCNQSDIGPYFVVRAQMFADFFTSLLQQQNRPRLGPFEFFVDLTSGTRNNVGLYNDLGLPILSFSRNPSDSYTIPLPDQHMLMGVLNDSAPYGFHKRYEYYTKGFSEIYKGFANTWDFRWEEKIPKVIFRGGCHPTIQSDNIYPSTREPLRSHLCALYGRTHDVVYDIGISMRTLPCSAMPNIRLCQLCSTCSNKSDLSWSEQAMYKYQLLVDGHGAANDATAWKLLSRSACILVHPDTWDSPIFEQFYYPLLVPYEHYIPASLSQIPEAIAWCEADDLRCKHLADAAYRMAKCIFNQTVLEEYVFKVLQYVHDVTHHHNVNFQR